MPDRAMILTLILLIAAGAGGCGGDASASAKPVGAAAPDTPPGSAALTYTHDGGTTRFNEVRAVRFDANDGSSELRLFFAAESLDGVVVTDYFGDDELRRWAFEGASSAADIKSAVDLRADASDPHAGFNGMIFPSQSLSTSGESAFPELAISEDQVSGTVSIADPFSESWKLEGTFAAPLTVVAQVQPITGEQIADTPQGRQVLKLMEKLETGNLDDIAPLVTPEALAEFRSFTEGMGPDEIRELTSGLRTEPEILRAAFADGSAQLSVAGPTALLAVVEKGDGYTSTTKMRLHWTDGKWLVSY